jgi:DNA replication protein DnaC
MKKAIEIAESILDTSQPKDTLTWSCSACKDEGYTSGAISYESYGASEKCFCKECEKGKSMFADWAKQPEQQEYFKNWKQNKIARALKLSGVDGLFRSKRLEDLKTTPTLQKECEKFVQNWQEMRKNGYGFFFWGNVGAGKTHTSTALANELMEKQLVEVLFLNMPETVTRVKKTFDAEIKTADAKLFDRMKEVELLVIDDLGVEKYSDWLSDQIYQIIDHRWKNQKPMIITSNQSLNDLGKFYKPQVASRIWGCCKSIKFVDKDRRKPIKPIF